jgi:hypothetical protein
MLVGAMLGWELTETLKMKVNGTIPDDGDKLNHP